MLNSAKFSPASNAAAAQPSRFAHLVGDHSWVALIDTVEAYKNHFPFISD
jgi:hypothetical protein